MPFDERWLKLGNAADFLRLDGIEFREYQFNIIKSILNHGSTLVVLPTGLGKTLIGVAVIADALSTGKKALLLAPTKPLSEQHYESLKKLLKCDEKDIVLLTGTIHKKERKELEAAAKVLVATPQTIANDLKSANFSLDEFRVAVFDECHRAVGKYAYTYIANELAVKNALIVGLTASPGSRRDKINALLGTLNIKHIEARASNDVDVEKYVMPKYVHFIGVDIGEKIRNMAQLIKPIGEESLKSLREMGLANFRSFESVPKGRLIEIGNHINRISAKGYKFGALFSYIRLLNTMHAYDLLVSEGIYPFRAYLTSLSSREEKGRAVENFLSNKSVVLAVSMADAAIKNHEEHPKVKALCDVLLQYKGKSAIVFAQYRSTIKMLSAFLNENGYKAMPFVGKKEGVTQYQQQKILDDFRNRKFDVLVASSIGEEGLDIPSVDLVVFYEPIPNEIRNIQRRGRTGRFRSGDIYIIFAKGTKDEIYLFISRTKEEKMMSLLKNINKKLESENKTEKILTGSQKTL